MRSAEFTSIREINMISIIRDKKDVTKAQLWEAYRDMVEHYEDALSSLSDHVAAGTRMMVGITGQSVPSCDAYVGIDEDGAQEFAALRAKCPDCGMPTIPDHQDLEDEQKRCTACGGANHGAAHE